MADEPWDSYDDEYNPDDDGRPKEEPDCGGCNDGGWVKPWGIRRLLAHVLPLCIVWWQWRGLLRPLGTLGGSWPCSGCNTSWIDWQLGRLDRWRWKRQMRRAPAWVYDDEPPF